MKLDELLDDCIARGLSMAQQIAQAQFGDDSPQSRAITRRWGITEVAELVGVTTAAIRQAEDEGRLPKPETAMRGSVQHRIGYTVDQIHHMLDKFGRRPVRPANADPVVISVAVNKGGAYKTSVSVHLAQWLALHGHRVLLVDIDPQATASLYHGYVPDVHVHAADTLLPFMLGDNSNTSNIIKKTGWPGLDIIPSCLSMHRIESEVYQQHDEGKLKIAPHLLLRAAIESCWDGYDVVIVDSSPSLGVGTINAVCAADVILVPTPAELYDYMSAAQFFTMLRDLLKNIDLGGFEPVVRVLVTKYSNSLGSQSAWMDEQIRNAWGGMVLREVVRVTDEVGKGQIRMRTVFEQAAHQRSTPNAWRNAVAIWEPVCREIYNRLIKTQWGVK